jgi:Zn-dependent membrane protease YugP
MNMFYWIIIGVFALIGSLVSNRLKSKFRKYSEVPLSSGLSGKEVAEKMLRDNGIRDVEVISVPGALTDHYNPQKKTVNLSDWVFAQRNVAAAAVAAHECGHAVQHARSYTWLSLRSSLVPIVSLSSRMLSIVLLAGIAVLAFSGNPYVLLAGIVLFAATTLFTFVTLPVEFDASNRALAWLTTARITSGEEDRMAKDALKWAAMTYVVAALASLAQLLYWVMIFMRSRD